MKVIEVSFVLQVSRKLLNSMQVALKTNSVPAASIPSKKVISQNIINSNAMTFHSYGARGSIRRFVEPSNRNDLLLPEIHLPQSQSFSTLPTFGDDISLEKKLGRYQ